MLIKYYYLKKSHCKYFISYNDVCYEEIIALQLRIDNFYSRIHKYANNNRIMSIYSDDKELFKKCRDIWNRITKLIGINNTPHFVRTTLDDRDVIMADVHENTSFVEVNPKDIKELVIVLDSIIYDYPKTSLVQCRY